MNISILDVVEASEKATTEESTKELRLIADMLLIIRQAQNMAEVAQDVLQGGIVSSRQLAERLALVQNAANSCHKTASRWR